MSSQPVAGGQGGVAGVPTAHGQVVAGAGQVVVAQQQTYAQQPAVSYGQPTGMVVPGSLPVSGTALAAQAGATPAQDAACVPAVAKLNALCKTLLLPTTGMSHNPPSFRCTPLFAAKDTITSPTEWIYLTQPVGECIMQRVSGCARFYGCLQDGCAW